MRPTIITRTGQGFNRQAVVSREETEQLDLSSGGLNITLRQRKRDSRWRVRDFFDHGFIDLVSPCNRRTWDKVCPLQERNSQSPVFFFFFFFEILTNERKRDDPNPMKKQNA